MTDSAKRWIAGTFSVLVLGAVLFPVVENFEEEPFDDFPLSYYPMFSKKRGNLRTERYLIGLDAEGNRHTIHYRYAGTGGMNQVRRQIRRRVRAGGAEELCAKVAERISRLKKAPYSEIVTVQVITGKIRLDRYYRGDGKADREKVEASCLVERSGP